MSFWEFANNHPIILLFCVWAAAGSGATMVKHISRAVTDRDPKKISSKLEINVPHTEAKPSEKAR